MTYLDLIRDADRKLDKGDITLGEYEKMIEPLKRAAKGHWLINSDGYYPYCSECKKEPKGGFLTDFCPNCGVDMRGKIKNNDE